MLSSYAIATVTLSFTAYYYTTTAGRWKTLFSKGSGSEQEVHAQRMTGVLLYGLVPAVVASSIGVDWVQMWMRFQIDLNCLYWMLGLGALATLLNWLFTRTPSNLALYPMIRQQPPWSKGLFFRSAFSWSAYLFAYEFLFRGFLLFTTARELGAEIAIIINISLYVMAHIHKGIVESLGSILMGALCCHISLEAGNIWPAAFVHIVLGLSNEWLSLWWLQRKS
jgi:hypothetical protein